MTNVLRVNDASTRADIAECIANVNERAKRVPHVTTVCTGLPPTEWDRRHEQINLLLDEMAGRAT